MTESLRRIAALVREQSGITLRESQLPSLQGAIRRAIGGDADEFLQLVSQRESASAAVALLLDHVAVKETSFLRDLRQLEGLDWRALLERARAAGREHVRLWSAGCATGEEAYTLALLAAEALGSFAPPVTVLGTDLSSAALEEAALGRYRPRSVRPLSDDLRRRYFEPEGEDLVVGRQLRALVRFAQHNLVRDAAPPRGEAQFDLVMCRNVLIYFDPGTVNEVVTRLESAVARHGVLVLGAADALCGTARGYGVVAAATGKPPERRRPAVAAPEGPGRRFDDRLAAAAAAADEGRIDAALAAVDLLLDERPLAAAAHYLRGVLCLEKDQVEPAIASFRRALSVDPGFGLAAFKLGRALESLGDARAAVGAYEQALRAGQESGGNRYTRLLAQVDFADVVAACRSRLGALR